MTLDNGFIRDDFLEQFKELLDDKIGTEYEFDEYKGFFTGAVEVETRSEMLIYEKIFEECKCTNYDDENRIRIVWNHAKTYSYAYCKLFDKNIMIKISNSKNEKTLNITNKTDDCLIFNDSYSVNDEVFSKIENTLDYQLFKLFDLQIEKLKDHFEKN